MAAETSDGELVIALVEESSFFRDIVGIALRSSIDGEVVGYGSIEDVSCADKKFELIVYSTSGCELTDSHLSSLALFTRSNPETPVAVIARDIDPAVVGNALAAGVRGLIPTSLGFNACHKALLFVHAGGLFIPAEQLLSWSDNSEKGNSCENGAFVPAMEQRKRPAPSVVDSPVAKSDCLDKRREAEPLDPGDEVLAISLTPRESVVASALKLGKTNKIIAFDLRISESTVKVHVRNIMKKLSATNRTQAALMIDALDSISS